MPRRPKKITSQADVESAQLRSKKRYDLTYTEMAKLSSRELRAYYSKLRAIAVKRLQRLASSGFADSQAYRDYRDEFVSLRSTNYSDSDVAGLTKRAQDFLNRRDSTVRGQESALRDAVKAIHDANLPELQPVLKTDKDGNILYEREEYTDKLGRKRSRYKYEYTVNPATGKIIKTKIPIYEMRMVGAFDWITEENAKEVFRFIDILRERAGSRFVYDPNELHELWSAYNQAKNKDFDSNKRLKALFNMFMGSPSTSLIVSTSNPVSDVLKMGSNWNAYKEMMRRKKEKQAKGSSGRRRGRPRKNRR